MVAVRYSAYENISALYKYSMFAFVIALRTEDESNSPLHLNREPDHGIPHDEAAIEIQARDLKVVYCMRVV